MANAKINLQCDIPVRNILCAAIRDYAYAAYPEGGSECAQVARYTLLELATQIETGIDHDAASVQISRRPRAMVRAAIAWFYDRQDAEQGGESGQQRARLLSLLQGERVGQAELEQAASKDRAPT